MPKRRIHGFPLVFILPFLILLPATLWGAANLVYHELSQADARQGFLQGDCVGPQLFVERLAPLTDEPYVLRVRLEFNGGTDQFRVYYTTNGLPPSGSFGNPQDGTHVVTGTYACQARSGTTVADIGRAVIPPQPQGTTVRYIIGAWSSSGGPEIFANGGNCAGCNISTTAQQATVFSYSVPQAPVITVQPSDRTVSEGSMVSFGVQASGTAPFSYQWRKDSQDLVGATNSALILDDVQSADEGLYSATVANAAGTAFSRAARLRVLLPPRVIAQPVSLVATQGLTAQFSVSAEGAGPFFYQWFLNGTNALEGANSSTLFLPVVRSSDEGNYQVEVRGLAGAVRSDEAALTVRLAPWFLTQPEDQAVVEGGSAAFAAEVSADPAPVYQWFFNGELLAGATESTLNIPTVAQNHVGLYTLLASNLYGSRTSEPAQLTIQEPPFIVAQPSDRVVSSGGNASFEVLAGGSFPLTYQWFRDGNLRLDNETNSILTLSNVQVTGAGTYRVRVRNQAGQVFSQIVTLDVLGAPVIVDFPPASLVRTNADTVALSAVAAGTPPLQYQWFYEDGIPLPGEVNEILSFSAVTPANAGRYYVEVSNGYGRVLSGTTTLTVMVEDFGDAPEPSFPTTRSGQGARHLVVPGFHLGRFIDYEADGQPSSDALGDNQSGFNDEDGVSWDGPLVPGRDTPMNVLVSTSGWLQAWIDFNRNGSWSDPGEQVLANQPMVPGNNVINVATPGNAVLGQAQARFRFSSSMDLPFSGPAPDGEVEDYVLTVSPPVDLALTVEGQPGEMTVGGTASIDLRVRNVGELAVEEVMLTAPLPRSATFLPSANLPAGCDYDEESSRLACALGTLAPDQTVDIEFSLRSFAAGTLVVAPVLSSAGWDFDPGNEQATVAIPVVYGTAPYANRDVIVMPEFLAGPSIPYPSTITVSGETSTVYSVVVSISGLTHEFPDDLDILLVGPQGQDVMLMSDAGSGFFTPVSNVSLTFDDAAGADLPDADQIVSGTYRPTNYRSTDPMEPPAPPGPDYGEDLAVFRGTDPNGTWSLYVRDDLPEDTGFIANGWTLQLTLADPMANVSVELAAQSSPALFTSNMTYRITARNDGPSRATGVWAEMRLPTEVEFDQAATADSDCVLESGRSLRCEMGSLAPGQETELLFALTMLAPGLVTNQVELELDQADFNLENNQDADVVEVYLIHDLQLSAALSASQVLIGDEVTYRIGVTNQGPFDAGMVVVTNFLPAQMTLRSATPTKGHCAALGGIVRCELGALAAGAGAQVLVRGVPLMDGPAMNLAFVGSELADFAVENNVASSDLTVLPSANLRIAGSAINRPVVGETLRFSLSISNQGPSTASSVMFYNPFPYEIEPLAATPSQGECLVESGSVTCQLGELAPGSAAMVSLDWPTSASGFVTNVAFVESFQIDTEPQDNFAALAAFVDPSADLIAFLRDDPSPVGVGQPLTYRLTVFNAGPDTAAAVTVSNRLPEQVRLLSAVSSQGVLQASGPEVTGNVGAIPAGGQVDILLEAVTYQVGLLTNLLSVASSSHDPQTENNMAMTVTESFSETGRFTNGQRIDISDVGAASPYPSTIEVGGVTNTVDYVQVVLHGLNHSFADDLDIFLEGPSGQTVYLMSDAGGASVLADASMTFSQNAGEVLPDEGPLTEGSYRPANYDSDSDAFPPPAPAPPDTADLSLFHQTDVNGTWSLYVVDDFSKDGGFIRNGWSLVFGTRQALNDLSLALGAQPASAVVGSNLTYSVVVTNHGPGRASQVALINYLPMQADLVSVTASQGDCFVEAGTVVCDLGDLEPGSSHQVNLAVRPLSVGSLIFSANVSGAETDVAAHNNFAYLTTTVDQAPLILVPPFAQSVPHGGTARFQVLAQGVAPLHYQWLANGFAIPQATNAALILNNVTSAQAGSYAVRVSNAAGAVTTPSVLLTVLMPVEIVVHPVARTGYVGGPAQFQVAAQGSSPLTYQWLFHGTPLLGATNAILQLSNLDPADAGDYSVTVANPLNMETSQAATLTVVEADFGDAPGTGYASRLANDGARHWLSSGLFLGAGVDHEPDAPSGGLADGDDMTGIDDEDGVRFLEPLLAGLPAQVEVVASESGVLNAWLDFAGNGTWNDAGDHFLTNQAVVAGTNFLNFQLRPQIQPTNHTYARFRLNSAGGLSPAGAAADGEVEDYRVTLVRQADLAVGMTSAPDPGSVNFNLVYEIGITNLGPLSATAVDVSASLPAGAFLIGLSSSQGSCRTSPQPECSLGELAPGQEAAMTLIVVPLEEGVFSNSVQVSAREFDPDKSNNTASTSQRVLDRVRIVSSPVSQSVVLGQPLVLSVEVAGSQPQVQWRFNEFELPGETNATLFIAEANLEDAGLYSAVVRNELNTVESSPATVTVLVPPVFVLQPQGATAPYGGQASFTGVAEGTQPLLYQWFHEGAAVPGATNSQLTIADAQPSQAGRYVLRASNAGGISFSEEVELILTGGPEIIQQPVGGEVLAGGSATLSFRAAGTRPLTIQWYRDGASLTPQGQERELVLTEVSPGDAGEYFAEINNDEGSAITETVILTVATMDFGDAPDPTYPTTLNSNGARHRIVEGVHLGMTVDFESNGQSMPPGLGDDQSGSDDEDGVGFSSPWLAGELVALQVEASVNGLLNGWVDYNRNGSWSDIGEQVFANRALVSGPNNLNLLVPSTVAAGTSHMRLRFSTAGGLNPTGEAADGEVEDYLVTFRQRANLAANVSVSADPAGVQRRIGWLLNVFNQGPAPATQVQLTNVLPANFVLTNIVSDTATCSQSDQTVICDLATILSGRSVNLFLEGYFTSTGQAVYELAVGAPELDVVPENNTAQLEVTVLDPVLITQQPAGLTTTNGSQAVLTVAASGSPPLSYQWWRNGVPLAGRTTDTLVLNPVTTSDGGDYRVLVSNPVGTTASQTVGVQVLAGTLITQQPVSQTALQGSTVTLSVQAAGDPPLSYQWTLDGTPLPGATLSTLTLTDVTAADAGDYRVSVTNPYRTQLSAIAAVSVFQADFGDAPGPGYATTLADQAAHHYLGSGLFLGNNADHELDGQPEASALGDDHSGVDDEDGVQFLGAVRAGLPASIQVRASAAGFLNAWFDYNGNGRWDDPGEHILVDRNLSAGQNNLNLDIPPQAVPGPRFARFRLSSTGRDDWFGLALDGEVEDYRVNVTTQADLAIAAMTTPQPASVGVPIFTSIAITNQGPGNATEVALNGTWPSSWELRAALVSQGNCVAQANSVLCDLDVIPAGGVVQALLELVPTETGLYDQELSVATADLDATMGNNSVTLSTMVGELPLILMPPASMAVNVGETAMFSVEAAGSGALAYQWQKDGVDLEGAAASFLTVPDVQPSDLGAYRVLVSNDQGTVASEPAMLSLAAAPMAATLPAEQVEGTQATLMGEIHPNGLLTVVWFEYGTTAQMPFRTAPGLAGAGQRLVTIPYRLSGLAAEQEYHFRVVATNALGQAEGEVLTFATTPLSPVFTAITRQASGEVLLEFVGSAGQPYEVWTSIDLLEWTRLEVATELGDGRYEFLDAEAAALGHRFYQVRLP